MADEEVEETEEESEESEETEAPAKKRAAPGTSAKAQEAKLRKLIREEAAGAFTDFVEKNRPVKTSRQSKSNIIDDLFGGLFGGK
jgi:hypothetical protein